jgi:hypothetical protein
LRCSSNFEDASNRNRRLSAENMIYKKKIFEMEDLICVLKKKSEEDEKIILNFHDVENKLERILEIISTNKKCKSKIDLIRIILK